MKYPPSRMHYLQVVKVPAVGEGTGESSEDVQSLVNHIGVMVDSLPEDGITFVRFFDNQGRTFCRWIEMDCLHDLTGSSNLALNITDHFWAQE